MSRNPVPSRRSVAFIIFGELSRDEFSRIHPLLLSFQDKDLQIQVIFVPLEDRMRSLDFQTWAQWGRSEGWEGIIFLPFVRVADLPWIGRGTLEDFPVYFLHNPGVQDLQFLVGALGDFLGSLAKENPEPGVGALYRFDILAHAQDPHPENDIWVSLRGDLTLLDKIPFLLHYLQVTSKEGIGNVPDGMALNKALLDQLKNEIFEKDVTIKRLLRSEKRYKKFFEDDITGDFVMDLSWRVVDCNRSFARIFGFPSTDYALGYDMRSFFPDRKARREVIRRFLQLNYLDYCELELVRPDGQQVHIIANLLGINGDDGRLIQIRGFLFDNTPRKNLEKQLQESQKMEGLGRLAGGIAHDFNNLLTVINGYAELLIAEMPAGSPQVGELGEILQAGLRATELTSQLLAFSRRQVLTPKNLNLNDLVRDLETMLGRLMNERIELVMDLADNLESIRADKSQLDQVIMNLVLNGRDAMPQGGRLKIQTQNLTIETSVYNSGELILPGRYVALKVSDTGVGMDEETLKKIFEPFFTTKEPGKGTGLGLAMVYGIVQQSGGYLKVTSEPGQGSEFTILFNAVEAKTAGERNLPEKEVKLKKGQLEKILLVEDEEMVRDYTYKILTRYGYQVKAFADGQAVLDFWKTTPQGWDLLITDVVMPRLSGPELVDALVAQGASMKVLFMSGYTDDEILRHGVITQKYNFLHKPFKGQDLLNEIREVLDQS